MGMMTTLRGLCICQGHCISITLELLASCLIVVDSNFFNLAWYMKDLEIHWPFYQNIKEVQVIEVDALGCLRLVQEH